MKLTQHLWFQSGMMDAVRTYVSLLPDSGIEWDSTVPADNPSGPAGSVQQVAFRLVGQNYMGLQAQSGFQFNESFSLLVEVDTQAELDRLWEALLDGGSAQMCGWLKDRWGLSWQIAPKRLGELMMNPDPAVARRVMEAMLKLVKLDIAPLEAAAKG